MMGCGRGTSPEQTPAAGFREGRFAAMLPVVTRAKPGVGQDGQMKRAVIGIGLAAAVLAGCQSGAVPKAPGQADLSAEIVTLNRPGPPERPEGACWESDVTPAVIETVTEQIVVTPEARDETGRVVTPATYRTDTRTRIVSDRREVWFRAPCPTDYTLDFVASLQRALTARGYYRLQLTGVLDAGTRDAVRRFQADRGLDSPRLSLAAARELGLLPVELDAL